MSTLILNKMPAFWHQFDFITLLNSPHAHVRWDYDVDYFLGREMVSKSPAEFSVIITWYLLLMGIN